jgi:uncharacterized damage-inducible protein DinB
MDLPTHFQVLAGYNRAANERLFERCSLLSREEYRRTRTGPFGSIHGLLNHLLLGDGIWMSRFEGGGEVTPALDTVLHQEFAELWPARRAMDERILRFTAGMSPEFLERRLRYVNNQGRVYVEEATVALAHFFNHQTHHRGQVAVMLAGTDAGAPSLDLHRIVNPTPAE